MILDSVILLQLRVGAVDAEEDKAIDGRDFVGETSTLLPLRAGAEGYGSTDTMPTTRILASTPMGTPMGTPAHTQRLLRMNEGDPLGSPLAANSPPYPHCTACRHGGGGGGTNQVGHHRGLFLRSGGVVDKREQPEPPTRRQQQHRQGPRIAGRLQDDREDETRAAVTSMASGELAGLSHIRGDPAVFAGGIAGLGFG